MKRTPYYSRAGITLYCGDSLEVAPELDAESVSAVVTDPPYGLGFMGKAWDKSVPGVPFWTAFMHAMKPGAHLLSFGGSRTYHRMGVAIEDAGLELRDTLMWLYGSGFPKSHDVSKAIDKAAGAEREVVGSKVGLPGYRSGQTGNNDVYGSGLANGDAKSMITAPATPEAAQWQGWGTALKPAHEPVILARKPFKGTVAANVLAHGTGALNIDGCRIPGQQGKPSGARNGDNNRTTYGHFGGGDERTSGDGATHASGRWPANVILDEAAAEGHEWSRYFYCAKSSRRERNAGLDGMPERMGLAGALKPLSDPRMDREQVRNPQANHHPTVKPLALMRYLVTLITPPGGIVLDPFAGSGSTLVACAELGFPAIGIELSEEYCEIIARRVDHALSERPAVVQPSLLEMVAD